jgi:hypothetical protein
MVDALFFVFTIYTTGAINITMTPKDAINLVEQLIAAQTASDPRHTDRSPSAKIAYERGVLTGILASIATTNSVVKMDIKDRLKQLAKNH